MALGLTSSHRTCVRPLLCTPFLSSNGHTDLAEDRILCFELVAKAKSNWSVYTSDCLARALTLAYVAGS